MTKIVLQLIAALSVWFVLEARSSAQTSLPAKGKLGLEMEQRIEAALDRLVSVQFEKQPLDQAISALSRYGGVHCVLDDRALADGSISRQTPISINLDQATLRTALRVILRPLRMTWFVEGETLVLTTQTEAENMLELRIYPVKDLVEAQTEGETYYDFDPLIDMVSGTIAPQTWDTVGGPGSLQASEVVAALVCSQTREVHEQMEDLIETLRKVREIQGVKAVQRPQWRVYEDRTGESGVIGGSSLRPNRMERRYVTTPIWGVPKVHR